MKDFNWTCPHCGRPVTISDSRYSVDSHRVTIDNTLGPVGLYSAFTVCPNPDCKKITLRCELHLLEFDRGDWHPMKAIERWNLIPRANVKSFPVEVTIPGVILNDYKEACLINELSPKASATLSRRCLQGILRDFWKVKPGKLVNEIKEIESKVDQLSWEAIDAVRNIGNIGAHMETDINVIVDVDPEEAEKLIELIEILIQNWYVETYMRNQ